MYDPTNLETLLSVGAVEIVASFTLFATTTWFRSDHESIALSSPLSRVLAGMLGATGAQTVFAGFPRAIIVGHYAASIAAPAKRA